MNALNCFKAYDIRGKIGKELDEALAKRIGQAYATFLNPKKVVLGGDIRATSESFKKALADGLIDSGVDVIDIGTTGTEEVYFATSYLSASGGIQVTASHNPIDFNGMKLVREQSKPIGQDTGLFEIKQIVEKGVFNEANVKGRIQKTCVKNDYVSHLMEYMHSNKIKTPIKLVVNSGNGAAGNIVDLIEKRLHSLNVPVNFVKLHHDADPTFPNGIPNPLLPENRHSTCRAVIEHQADLGIAFDGDFDRCFFFDERGNFIEGYYIVGLLAAHFLQKEKNGIIVHDPRLTWNTKEIVQDNHGIAIQSRTGHAFIKDVMRKNNAIYGGEMSAHHYFRDFAFCDSGMIPWLVMLDLLGESKQPFSNLIAARIARFPASGEINRVLTDPQEAIQSILEHFKSSALSIENIDGISVEFSDWRFNLRASNTEPVVRLNVEARQNQALLASKTNEVLELLAQFELK